MCLINKFVKEKHGKSFTDCLFYVLHIIMTSEVLSFLILYSINKFTNMLPIVCMY